MFVSTIKIEGGYNAGLASRLIVVRACISPGPWSLPHRAVSQPPVFHLLTILLSTTQCTRELLQAYYIKLAQTHSSGLYVVLDAGPRPTRIDTLPSHLIEWSVPPPRTASQSNGTIRHDEPDSSSESSESEPEQPQRRSVPTASSSFGSSHSTHRSPLGPPHQSAALSASISVPISRVTSPSTSHGRPPPKGFRSPMIGRRRRRPSLIDPTSRAAAEIGSEYDVDVTALEGKLRGSRRRRIEIDDGREGEPGTPV